MPGTTAAAGTNGSFGPTSITVPAAATAGSHTISALGKSTDLLAQAAFNVTPATVNRTEERGQTAAAVVMSIAREDDPTSPLKTNRYRRWVRFSPILPLKLPLAEGQCHLSRAYTGPLTWSGAKGTRTPGLLHAIHGESVWHGPRWSGPCRSERGRHVRPSGDDRHGLDS
jgi:hypothetical protein